MSTSSPPRRYLSIWLRRLSTDRLARRATPAADEGERAPLVVAHRVKSALRIAAMNDAAARLGLTPGMALADARARHPAVQVAASDPVADLGLIEAVADWCDRYTPLVGIDAPAGVMLDIAGCAHLFGGEAALCRDIVARLSAQGLRARVAVADTPGCAWGVARHEVWDSQSPRRGEPIFIVPPGAMRQALAPLPLSALRLDPATIEALADVGLVRIADVFDLPRAGLAARFHAAFLRRLDQALGREDDPITPRRPAPAYMAEQHFAEPIMRERDVHGTIARLGVRLGYAMEAQGEGARRLELALFRTDGAVHRIALGTGAPLREANRISRLFADRLAGLREPCDPGFGYDLVRLSAPVTERWTPVQTSLAADSFAADPAAELGHLVDRLGARFGLRRVTRFVPQNAHIPEFAVAAVPAAHAVQSTLPSERRNDVTAVAHLTCPPSMDLERVPDPALQSASPLPVPPSRRGSKQKVAQSPLSHQSARCSASRSLPLGQRGLPAPGPNPQDTLAPARPARLFARPERIEALAEVPDGPPIRFRWRRMLHEVAAAEGPERIAPEWWRGKDGMLTRDYFRVETRAGFRVWLYREGLYAETAQPRWFLHGLFG